MATIAVVAGLLWLHTQAAMEVCEIEVMEISRSNFLDQAAFDSSDNASVVPQWNRLEYRYLSPEHLTDFSVLIFMHPTPEPREIETPHRIMFRYRSRSLWWLPIQDPQQTAIDLLAIKPENIEQIINQKIWTND